LEQNEKPHHRVSVKENFSNWTTIRGVMFMDEATFLYVLLHYQTQVHCVKNHAKILGKQDTDNTETFFSPHKGKTVLEMGIQLLTFAFLFC
jgi:hypothetical protein